MSTAESSPADFSRLEEFDRYFELSVATSRQQRKQVHEIRYRVYCKEFGYEPPEEFSNDREVDEFDSQSVHCLVIHRESGLSVGCVRVVMVEGDDRMPMEAHAGDCIDRTFLDEFKGRRGTVCEISRLAVDAAFRRRRREQGTRLGNIQAGDAIESERRTFPLIARSLMIGAGALADVLGRKHCFAIMEPFLPVMLRRAGIHFRRVGPDLEFHGVRAPYYGNLDELFDSAPAELRLYFNTMRDQFAAAIETTPQLPTQSEPRSLRVQGDRINHLWWPELPGGSFA
ncbi:MAG: PEP-CTERM/exosortase system-associated acyltransferase [Pseudohongiellaceae bacterium]